MRAMQRQLKEQLAEQKESFDRLTAELSSLRKDQKQQGSALQRLTTKEIFSKNIFGKIKEQKSETSARDSTSPIDHSVLNL